MKKGFSLIELLVVIVIIGILSGIGIAQFKGHQEKARDAKLTAECAFSERCLLLKQTCVDGGGSGCDSLCDTSDLSCQLEFVDGSNSEAKMSVVGAISGSLGSLTFVNGGSSNWINSVDPILAAGEDGFLEFTVESPLNSVHIGFGDTNNTRLYYHGFNLWNSTSTTYSMNKYSSGGGWPYSVGDKFKIERIGLEVRYTVNGALVRTDRVGGSSPLYLFGRAGYGGSTLSNFKTGVIEN